MINTEQFDIITVGNTQLYNLINSEDINLTNAFLSLFKELYFFPITTDGYFAYEIEEMTVNNNDIVVDCGGNLGLFAAWAESQGAKVYSFEPSFGTINFLHKIKQLHPNIIIEQKAVGDLCSTIDFVECYFSCGSHLADININDSCISKEQYPVEMITLDSYFNDQHVDFIKIDVEGAEMQVLKGALNILKRDKPKIAIACYHFKDDEKKIKQMISEIDISYKFKRKNDILFSWIP